MPLFSLLCSPVQMPDCEPAAQLWQAGSTMTFHPTTPGLEQGVIRMNSVTDDAIFEGEQRDENRLGMWSFEVEPDLEVSIRIEGTEHYPTIWRARTPYTEGYWYSGAIFGVKTVTFDAFLESLAELTGEPMSDEGGVHVW